MAAERAGFSEHNLWLTLYDPNQRYAPGLSVMGSKGEDSLPQWIRQNRKIMNTDIVAWYTMGFHYVLSPADRPQMPIMWRTFTLLPYQFLPKQPHHGPAHRSIAGGEDSRISEFRAYHRATGNYSGDDES